MSNAIEIRGLCKQFHDFSLQDINLTLPGGTIMGLIGENGAGKTTTIKCILNILHKDAGEIRILGHDSVKEAKEASQDIGLVLDECFYHDTLTPKYVDRIMRSVYKNWDSALYRQNLKKYDLPENKILKEFSRGMKMKFSLAVALAHHPRLLILDEATAGLDPVVRDEILDEFLGFIQDEDHSILLSSHITSDLEKIADYITYIHQGKVILSDAKDNLLENYGRVGCTSQELATLDRFDVLRVRRGPFGCEALVKDLEVFKWKYPSMNIDRVTLDDIMLFIGKGETLQ